MRRPSGLVLFLLILTMPWMAWAQQSQPSSNASSTKAPAATPQKKSQGASGSGPNSGSSPGSQKEQPPVLDPDAELEAAVRQAGNDPAALIRNMEAFLARHPDSPRRREIYRGIFESEMQAHNQTVALDYAERLIALDPDDLQTMFLATTILVQMPDEASQLKGINYSTELIDSIVKANPDERPQQMSLDDWQAGRIKFTATLHILRGRLERNLHKADDAVKDFNEGFRLLPNAEAALELGEVAEEQGHADEAVRQYALAYFLTGNDSDSTDTAVNRDSLRLRIGNLWRFSHDSNSGLGDVLLDALDKSRTLTAAEKPEATAYNQGVSDPLQFALRRVDGSGTVNTADSHGKIVILNFWTTWCTYCQILEPMLAEVRKRFSDRNDVVSLSVNADEEESSVAPFLTSHNIEGTLVFADGLDHALHVDLIPTVIVLDRSGKVAYRSQGFAPEGFVDAVSGAVTKAATTPAQ